MSFTGRIRLYLVAIALLPPLVMMVVVFMFSAEETNIRYRQSATEDLTGLDIYYQQYQTVLVDRMAQALGSSWFEQVVYSLGSGGAGPIEIDAAGFDLDFLELCDSNGVVLASSGRPGLVGRQKRLTDLLFQNRGVRLGLSVEYDLNGRHAAHTAQGADPSGYVLYGGWYTRDRLLPIADRLISGECAILFPEDATGDQAPHERMDKGQLYSHEELYTARLGGSEAAGFYLIAKFAPDDSATLFDPFIEVITLVALVSVLLAIGIGFYISGKAKREINNLVDAFTRVASGDLTTTVMAYEEGEFATLADSFSAMIARLRGSQQKLATAEKVAAWQAIARKIAHEIKNPLTPIAISADDLRRSWNDKLPGFDATLNSSTRMIREEVTRLTRLLDEFVAFARMAPPNISSVPVDLLVSDLTELYAEEVRSDRLVLATQIADRRIAIDPDQIKQVLINLIKNGFESKEGATVTVTFADTPGTFRISVTDDGPGFAQSDLDNPFEPRVSSKQGGSGLGLLICQRTILDHGGIIEIENQPQGGAAIRVILPQEQWPES